MNIHVRPPRTAKRLVRLFLPVPAGAGPRAVVEAQIELLISLLDRIDPDPDLEDTGDFEPECEDEGAQCDDEGADRGVEDDAWFPSLSSYAIVEAETAKVRHASQSLAAIVARVKGREAALAMRP